MTAAIFDRLLHRCHIFNIRRRSYRLRHLEELVDRMESQAEEASPDEA